jgi:phosphoribosyl 1,2-cyclic phosphodiesterase
VDRIIFLGTGGARVVVSRQIRASGGMWFTIGETNFIVDPGPGALVRATAKRKPKLDPTTLDGIILSHRHLDHAADANVMIDAMTSRTKKRGTLFLPRDAIAEDPVVLRYARERIGEIVILEEGGSYRLGDVTFDTPIRHIHVETETYGMSFCTGARTVSYIADTRFFPELIDHYTGEILIMNVSRYTNPKDYEVDHLNVADAKRIIEGVRPEVAILTHFGMTMLRAKPWEVAAALEEETGVRPVSSPTRTPYGRSCYTSRLRRNWSWRA